MRFFECSLTVAILLVGSPAVIGQTSFRDIKDPSKLSERERVYIVQLAVDAERAGGQTLDLASLVRLSGILPWGDRLDSSEDEWLRYSLAQMLVNRHRAELEKLTLDQLRDLAFKTKPPYLVSEEAFYGRWIQAEVNKMLSEPKPDLSALFSVQSQSAKSGTSTNVETERYRATAPYRALCDRISKAPRRSLEKEGGQYDQLVREFFYKGKPMADELLRFDYDYNDCGQGGGDRFDQIRTYHVFMSLLRERRIAEALGASLSIWCRWDLSKEPIGPPQQWRADLIALCGFDPESMMITDYEFLATSGSEKGALSCIERFPSTEPDYERMRHMHYLAAFLVPGPSPYSNEMDPRMRISTSTQMKLFSTIEESMREDRSFREIDEALKVTARLKRPELKEAVRRLLKHPSAARAERAASVLRFFGEEIAPIPPAPPVRFHVYRNGEPWRLAKFSFRFADGGRGGDDGLKTDSEGVLSIPRDRFLDPLVAGKRLILYEEGEESRGDDSWYGKVWVQTEIIVPDKLDDIPNVHFSTCSVPFEVKYATAPPPVGAETLVKLVNVDKAGKNLWSSPVYLNKGSREVPSRFTLGTIMPGTYRLYIHAPGSVRHLSQPFEVKAGMESVPISLKKGAEVYAEICAPENARGFDYRLFHWNWGWEDITDRHRPENGSLFTGLPKGSYQLRVLSTKQYLEKLKSIAQQVPPSTRLPIPREEVDCEGFTVSFKITDETPALLDLGRLENKAIDTMRDKAGPMRSLRFGALRK